MSKLLTTVCGSAALAMVASAQSATVDASKQQKAPTLASSRWFVDAVPKGIDEEDPQAPRALELEFVFDVAGRLQLKGASPGFDVLTKVELSVDRRMQFDIVSADHGAKAFRVVVGQNRLTGAMTWHPTDHEAAISYELSGRRATALDGTAWTFTVTPQPVSEDVDEPFTAVFEFHRGLVRVLEDEESQIYFDPVDYVVTYGSQGLVVAAGGGSTDLVGLELSIVKSTATGSLRELDDGRAVATYQLQGQRRIPAQVQ